MGKIICKRKVFVAPALAAAGGKLMTGATVASVPLMGAQMVQSHNQAKDATEQAEKQAEQQADIQRAQERENRKMREKMDAQNKALEKIASNGGSNMGQQAASVLKGFSTIEENEKCFGAVWNWKNIKGFAGDLGRAAWKRNDVLATGIAFAAPAAVVGYGVDKFIQHDKAKIGNPVEGTEAYKRQMRTQQMQQKSYSGESVLSTIGKGAKEFGGKILNSKGSMVIGGVIAATPLIGHFANRSMEKQQVAQTVQNPKYQMRTYSVLTAVKNVFRKPTWFDKFKQDKLGTIASNIGGGTREDVKKFGNEFKSGDLSKKFGNFVKDNQALSVVGSVGLGWGAFGLADKISSDPIKAGLKKVDKDAFAYEQSQQQQIK